MQFAIAFFHFYRKLLILKALKQYARVEPIFFKSSFWNRGKEILLGTDFCSAILKGFNSCCIDHIDLAIDFRIGRTVHKKAISRVIFFRIEKADDHSRQ